MSNWTGNRDTLVRSGNLNLSRRWRRRRHRTTLSFLRRLSYQREENYIGSLARVLGRRDQKNKIQTNEKEERVPESELLPCGRRSLECAPRNGVGRQYGSSDSTGEEIGPDVDTQERAKEQATSSDQPNVPLLHSENSFPLASLRDRREHSPFALLAEGSAE